MFIQYCVLVLLIATNCVFTFEARDILKNIVPKPIRCFFKILDTCVDRKDEQGALSFWRNSIQRIYQKFQDYGDSQISSSTQGLDCDIMAIKDESLQSFKSHVKFIYPGTKWCGAGNKSKNSSDLGTFRTSDVCCRRHDMCPIRIEAGKTAYGLKNTGLFARSHCYCDQEFYKCLKDAKNLVASSIGRTYFNILGPQCFQQDYPFVNCIARKLGRCTIYEKDLGKPKVYSWIDNFRF